MNDLVFLNIALLKFGLDHLVKKGYQPMWTPFFLNSKAMRGAAELGDFEQQLYKIEGDDLFLIATSEQTLASFHKDEILDENRLPLKYAGVSSCFRREAGAHGKDTRGIFRVHQFEKIEQYVFCKPEDSWKLHEEILGNAEELFKVLGIPYRVVNIASGELNDSAAKKYDIEAWFPAQNQYREVVSASNCVDYQSRKLNVKYGKAGGFKEVVHSLNSTAIATERAICCILENFQQKDGSVLVPKALQPYMNGKECIGK
jgi:seryl-tRNA synthetase